MSLRVLRNFDRKKKKKKKKKKSGRYKDEPDYIRRSNKQTNEHKNGNLAPRWINRNQFIFQYMPSKRKRRKRGKTKKKGKKGRRGQSTAERVAALLRRPRVLDPPRLEFEVWHKEGSLLRSDRLLGEAECLFGDVLGRAVQGAWVPVTLPLRTADGAGAGELTLRMRFLHRADVTLPGMSNICSASRFIK